MFWRNGLIEGIPLARSGNEGFQCLGRREAGGDGEANEGEGFSGKCGAMSRLCLGASIAAEAWAIRSVRSVLDWITVCDK